MISEYDVKKYNNILKIFWNVVNNHVAEEDYNVLRDEFLTESENESEDAREWIIEHWDEILDTDVAQITVTQIVIDNSNTMNNICVTDKRIGNNLNTLAQINVAQNETVENFIDFIVKYAKFDTRTILKPTKPLNL